MTVVSVCDSVCWNGGVVSLSVLGRGFVTVVSDCDSVCWNGGVVSLSVWRRGFVTVVSVYDFVCWKGVYTVSTWTDVHVHRSDVHVFVSILEKATSATVQAHTRSQCHGR